MNELTSKQEDFLLEQARDKDYYKKNEITPQNQSLGQYKASDDEFDDGMFMCVHCGGIFDENDLDKCDGDFICRLCEDKLK